MLRFFLLCSTLFAVSGGPAVLTAAPAPFQPKDDEVVQVNESYLIGSWEVTCGGSKSRITFCQDGRYFCQRGGREFDGKWKFATSTVRVEESIEKGGKPGGFDVWLPKTSVRAEVTGVVFPNGQEISLKGRGKCQRMNEPAKRRPR